MSAGVDRPIIFPISNPTSQIEVMPADIIAWSEGQALVATGLPIPPAGLRRRPVLRSARPTTPCCTPAWGWARSSPAPPR